VEGLRLRGKNAAAAVYTGYGSRLPSPDKWHDKVKLRFGRILVHAGAIPREVGYDVAKYQNITNWMESQIFGPDRRAALDQDSWRDDWARGNQCYVEPSNEEQKLDLAAEPPDATDAAGASEAGGQVISGEEAVAAAAEEAASAPPVETLGASIQIQETEPEARALVAGVEGQYPRELRPNLHQGALDDYDAGRAAPGAGWPAPPLGDTKDDGTDQSVPTGEY
jgi:hypothetical protein